MPVQLTQNDVADLKAKGFSEAEISKAVNELNNEESKTGIDVRSRASQSSFGGRPNEDIARWQLELNDLLAETEHILKGDVVVYVNRHRLWMPNPNPELNPLNEWGVRLIMNELHAYVNRHIILGDYEMDEIKKIMIGYGKKINNLVFMKYEEMGMDTDDKRKEYASMITNVVNTVYGAYKRAWRGGERKSLREQISYSQASQVQQVTPINSNGQPQQKTRGIFNPMRYIAGKYV